MNELHPITRAIHEAIRKAPYAPQSHRQAVNALADKLLADDATKAYFSDFLAIGGSIACTTAAVRKAGVAGDPGITLTQLRKTHPDVAIRIAQHLAIKRLAPTFPRGGQPLAQETRSRCVHLGQATGAKVLCPSCAGRTELFVMRCEVHGQCTIGKKVPDLQCCATCAEYAPAPADNPRTPDPA